jgi:hypothetical protein
MKKAGCWSGQFIEIYARAKDLALEWMKKN